jgi:hypothetical protein
MRRIREGMVDKDIERELGKLDYGTLVALDQVIKHAINKLDQSVSYAESAASYVESAYAKVAKTVGVNSAGKLKDLLDRLNEIIEDSDISLSFMEEYVDLINYYMEDAYARR